MISDCDDGVHLIFVVFHNMEDAYFLVVGTFVLAQDFSPCASAVFLYQPLFDNYYNRHLHYLKTPPYLGYLLHLPHYPHLRHLPQSLLRKPLLQSLEHIPMYFVACKNHQHEGVVGKVVVCRNHNCTSYLGQYCIAQHKMEVAMGDRRKVLN